MLSIPLKIFIHGLIALVPVTDPSGAKMTALLVDGRTASPDPLQCMAAHYPRLRFFAAEDSQCIAAGCKALGNCDCVHDLAAGQDPLIRKQIWFEISPSPILATDKPSSSLPGHGLPDDSREAGSFSSRRQNLSQEPCGLTSTRSISPPILLRKLLSTWLHAWTPPTNPLPPVRWPLAKTAGRPTCTP